ncbi:hypothetical protein D3C80_1231170 [compost metagenome]
MMTRVERAISRARVAGREEQRQAQRVNQYRGRALGLETLHEEGFTYRPVSGVR